MTLLVAFDAALACESVKGLASSSRDLGDRHAAWALAMGVAVSVDPELGEDLARLGAPCAPANNRRPRAIT